MKKPEPTPIVSLEIADDGLGPLVAQVRSLLQSARRAAAVSINSLQVRTNYEIGRLIVEHEQQGQQRAPYGKETLNHLAASLSAEFGRGYSKTHLEYLAHGGQIVSTPADVIKDPYVLEFLGLEASPGYSESDLERAIISKLEHFLLELGKGFLFEGRQKRFTFDEDHFYVDLVFYNRLLRCYVLIDLKLDQLTYQDLGQMQMYVNYFDRYVKTPEEDPTVGIVLCRRKKDALVELTLPKDANIFAAAYQLYLPTKEDLRAWLMEWVEESGDAGEASPD
ncbi:MAG: hypothetical protein JWQ02_2381 [Capsulimonas sp.]|nr:hypothetical protein [Capsulimonas sp.]